MFKYLQPTVPLIHFIVAKASVKRANRHAPIVESADLSSPGLES